MGFIGKKAGGVALFFRLAQNDSPCETMKQLFTIIHQDGGGYKDKGGQTAVKMRRKPMCISYYRDNSLYLVRKMLSDF